MSASSAESHAEVFLPLDDGEIHVCQDGPRDAPALLLIHGTAATARSWEPMLPRLTGSHRVIRIDLLGCGQSANPDRASYAAPDQAHRADLTDEQLRRAASSAFAPGYQIPQPFFDQVRDMDLGVFAATSQAVRAYLDERGLPDRLTTLAKPLLVIFGEEDRRWRSSSAVEYLAVPGAKVEMMPGAGHSPNLEDPARTAATLLAFTANHRQGRRQAPH
jgi:pimeloyl-ACP methyl ester carboxylesterase